MKTNNILGFILEGTDGVGKTSLRKKLTQHYNYSYFVYDRGEISNYVYSKIYQRPFIPMQRHLPILYIILYCNENELINRITKRDMDSSELKNELNTIKNQEYFLEAAEILKNDYNIIVVDTSSLTESEVLEKVIQEIEKFIHSSKNDEELSNWNKNYKKGCEKLNLEFVVKDKQVYINNIPACTDASCYNGVYETFTNSKFPISLIYSLSYDEFTLQNKKYDFCYFINSKINCRPEVFEYYNSFINNNKTCLVSNNYLVPDNKNLIKMKERVFGNGYIEKLSEARATIYCARELNYLSMLNARFYESILAENIIFVDKLTDTRCELLEEIYGKNTDIIKYLYVTPETICQNYDYIVTHNLIDCIIQMQHKFYKRRKTQITFNSNERI